MKQVYNEILTNEQIDALPLDMTQVEFHIYSPCLPEAFREYGVTTAWHLPGHVGSGKIMGKTRFKAKQAAIRSLKRKLLQSGWYK